MTPLTFFAAGMQLYVVAGVNTFSDLAGTIPATNGSNVVCWGDLSGNGNHLKPFSGFGVGSFVNSGPITSVNFNNNCLLAAAVAPSTPDPISVHWYGKTSLPDAARCIFGFRSDALPNGFFCPDDGGTISWANAHLSAAFNQTDGSDHLISAVQNAGVVSIYLDGVLVATGTGALPQVTNFMLGGSNWNGGQILHGQVTEAMVCYAAHSPAQIAAYFQYLQQTYAARYAGPAVVFIGNSLGTTYASGRPSICQLACTSINQTTPINRWVNASLGGITTPQITANIPSVYGPLIRAETLAGQQTVAVIMEGTNDLLAGSTPQQAYANLITCAQQLRLAGATKIVLATVIARNGLGSPANFDAVRLPLNALIRADKVNFDAIADVGADATIGNAANINGPAFVGDQAHLSAAGNQIAAPYFATSMQAAIQATASGILNALALLYTLQSQLAAAQNTLTAALQAL